MATSLATYFAFDGNTAEVMEHWHDVFGGEVGMPLEEAPWGDWYGQVFDKFGVMWAFSCENATLDA